MGVNRDDRAAELEEDNELEDLEFGNLSRKARRKMLEERLGKKEVAQQIKDGTLSLGKKGFDFIRTRRVKSDEVRRLHGGGDGERIRDYNDPSKW